MIHYFAYGSNLHPVRLVERVPSARLIGRVLFNEHSLAFHKKGKDGSGKCNRLNTGKKSDVVHGALYRLDAKHKSILDNYERNGSGYFDTQVVVEHDGEQYDCFTYIAQQSYIVEDLKPYDWYKELVFLGAKYLGFPEDYIASIEAIESVEDPDSQRRLTHHKLIEEVRNFR